MADTCVCGVLHVGWHSTGARNWNPDCLEHGLKSAWWNSDAENLKREAQSITLRALQKQAREARQKVAGAGLASNAGLGIPSMNRCSSPTDITTVNEPLLTIQQRESEERNA